MLSDETAVANAAVAEAMLISRRHSRILLSIAAGDLAFFRLHHL
jgi:hypothetical protein